MTIKPILKMGNPLLLQRSQEVIDPVAPEISQLITDLFDTMYATKGIGLSAPQIGINLRVMIFGFEKSERYPNAKPVPTTILINPTIEILTQTMQAGWEGCIRVPGLRGVVSRPTKIHYQGIDEKGQPIDRIATDFHARMVQHEYDHLEGILFPQRITDMRLFGFENEVWDKIITNNIPVYDL